MINLEYYSMTINKFMKRKKPTKKFTPPPSLKKPRIDSTIKGSMNMYPVWHLGMLDVNGPWGWNTIEKTFFFDKILPKVSNFESMFWKDIVGRNNHEIPVSSIISEAQKRLAQIRLDDTEVLFSFRLTGEQRIWGIKAGNIFKILWWDPKHQICPSLLKHT